MFRTSAQVQFLLQGNMITISFTCQSVPRVWYLTVSAQGYRLTVSAQGYCLIVGADGLLPDSRCWGYFPDSRYWGFVTRQSVLREGNLILWGCNVLTSRLFVWCHVSQHALGQAELISMDLTASVMTCRDKMWGINSLDSSCGAEVQTQSLWVWSWILLHL